MAFSSSVGASVAPAFGVVGALADARWQMALSLGAHIVIACLGVGMPVLMLAAERRFLATGDRGWRDLARLWSKVFAVLFAVGAVTGTILAFELALLWPGWIAAYGAVFGLPFTLEAFAFLLEAIFLGIYLYGWDRLTPRAHFWAGVPVALSGLASLAFVVSANAWMNAPRGFDVVDGRVTDVRPFAAMASPAALPQIVHMALASYMVTGFLVAAVHARALLRSGRGAGNDGDLARRRGATLAFVLAAGLAPAQALAGHWAGTVVARTQPVKLAALEGQFETTTRAPLRIGGFPDETAEVTRFAIEIPGGLSWMAYGDADARVLGLSDVPREDRPPVAIVHVAFQAMVGAGTALIALALWAGASGVLRKRLPRSRAFLWALVASGPLSVLALEAGWVVTEVGRQPWIVQGRMRVAEAFTDAPGTGAVLWAAVALLLFLGVFTFAVLRRVVAPPAGGASP